MSGKLTPLSDIGMFGLIDHVAERFKPEQTTSERVIGQGAAVINPGNQRVISDSVLLLEGIHFDLTYFPLKHLGYKAVVAATAGIIASGARPSQISLSLGLSGKMSLEGVDLLMEGVGLACKEYGIDLIGFRPSSSLTGLTIGATAYGMARGESVVGRSNAQPNDLICVTGNLGAAYMGLQLLEREKKVMDETGRQEPDFGSYEYLLQRQLRPEARITVLNQLQESNLHPTSMIEVRESFAASLLHLCKASGTGCHIYENKIPIDPATTSLAEEMGINPLVAALNGGEDYEMLFTLSLDTYQQIEKGASLNDVFLIGHLTGPDKGYTLETLAGEEMEVKAQGWGT